MDRSSKFPMQLGVVLKNQMCVTGTASLMHPIRSRRTFDSVISTPHRSHVIPRCFTFLYLPHPHSQSFTGPKMRSQNRPSFSGLKVR